MHRFPVYTTGKTALFFKRSYEGTLKVVMLDVTEVLLSKISDSCYAFFEIQPAEFNFFH